MHALCVCLIEAVALTAQTTVKSLFAVLFDRCHSQIVHRLHQLHDVVAKRADITVRLQHVSTVLDNIASSCQQLSADIGPSQHDADALMELSQVCINAKLYCRFCHFIIETSFHPQ